MANQYLIGIHEYISSKIEEAMAAKEAHAGNGDSAQISYLDGKLDQLGAIRRFLKEHYDLPTQQYY